MEIAGSAALVTGAASGLGAATAAALRAALPPDRAGLLAIRSRVVDILAYSTLGLAVVLLAVTITRGSLTVT